MTNANDDQQAKINLDKECVDAALKLAVIPLYPNRFELLPFFSNPDQKQSCVLVFGGVISGSRSDNTGESEEFTHVNMHGAYVLNRNFASDIIVRLQQSLELSEDDLRDARVRNGI